MQSCSFTKQQRERKWEMWIHTDIGGSQIPQTGVSAMFKKTPENKTWKMAKNGAKMTATVSLGARQLIINPNEDPPMAPRIIKKAKMKKCSAAGLKPII